MVLHAYLRIKGQKQGDIKGSVTAKGRENSIQVMAAAHSITSPRDAASGLPTGKRMHKPFTITKEVDKSSPLLYMMMISNEIITSWELQFWSASRAGLESQDYTVKLTNAYISNIDFHMPDTRNADLAKYQEYEEISFTYQTITWTWTDGGVTAQDNWSVVS